MSFESIGSIRRIASIVCGAAASQRAVNARSPTVIRNKLGEDARPIRLTQALTDSDGRVRDLLERPMSPGDYRLEFILSGRTIAEEDDTRFFRKIAIDLRVEDVSRSYHVPLLLAPYSMTTYRGS